MTRTNVLKTYIGCIGLLAAGVIGYSVYLATTLPPHDLLNLVPALGLLIVLGWYLSQRRVLVSESDSWAMGTIAHIGMVVILPYQISILAVAMSKALAEFTQMRRGQRRRKRAIVINAGSTILATAAGVGVFHVLNGEPHLWSRNLDVLYAFPALLVMAVLYHEVNQLVVVGAITLTSREAPWSVFARLSQDTVVPEYSQILIGIVFAVLWHSSPVLAAFVIVPVILSLRAFESIGRLRKETLEAVLKMAEFIDYRDTGTYEHSKRLAELSGKLARALGLTAEHVGDIVLTARVHDLGKIGISNEILLKQGPLTAEETEIMEQHPIIGSEMLASYSMFKSSIEMVRHHHERWDGKGYPDRIAGELIPLGARIIAIADSFDAMTADRPYRKGMSVDQAVERLKAGMGTQYDPKVCAAFIQLLIEEEVYVPVEPAPDLRIVSARAV